MTTLIPAPAYTDSELQKLYPKNLALQQVQFFLRHGERTPITNGFQHLGLLPYWPLCESAGKFNSVALGDSANPKWESLNWKRKLEAIRPDDGPMTPVAEGGKVNNICNIGELTDIGRKSILDLGSRIRRLYVDQLGFMPKTIGDKDSLYIRASPYSRALESTQQAFQGLYPSQYRQTGYVPEIVQRSSREETLLPNEEYCTRFIQMMQEYSQKAADKWNGTADMDKLNSLIGKYMPGQQRVAVDSTPRIAGIYDAVNSTQAARHSKIKLPNEFYDPEARKILDKIAFEEEFIPFQENKEYRTLGIGALLGDVVERMTQNVEGNDCGVRFALSGGHDSTLMGLLGGLGTLKGQDNTWPPYSSNVAIELFKDQNGGDKPSAGLDRVASGLDIGRTKTGDLTADQKQRLNGYYVRMRFNDKVVSVPGCKPKGRHLEGDESFCTLAAFKEICDKITPTDVRSSCLRNLDKPAIPNEPEPAGY